MSIFGKISSGTNFAEWTKLVKCDKLWRTEGVIFNLTLLKEKLHINLPN